MPDSVVKLARDALTLLDRFLLMAPGSVQSVATTSIAATAHQNVSIGSESRSVRTDFRVLMDK
jgi:hypothetical protein